MRGRAARGCLLVAFALVVTACGTDGSAINPSSPGRLQGDQARYGLDDDTTDPACFLARDVDQAARLWALAGREGTTPVGFDPPVVGIFLAPRPTGGYAVDIASWRQAEDGATVLEATVLEATVRRPASGDAVTAAETSPFLLLPLDGVSDDVRIEGDIDLSCVDRVPQVAERSSDGDREGEGS